MSNQLPRLTMSNGVDFPIIGYGTGMLTDAEQLKKSLDVVLECGYKNIDTAQMYSNEHIIGDYLEEAIKNGKLKRTDIFLTSKLAPFYHHPDEAEKAIQASLKKLKTDYIDCFLIHAATPVKPVDGGERTIEEYRALFHQNKIEFDNTPHIDTWRVLEKYYKKGVFKSIGLSNFNEQQIQDIYDKAEVKPMNLQVECHVYLQQYQLQDFCKKLGIVLTSYSTLGNPGRPANYKKESDPEPLKDAYAHELAKKYNKDVGQILLRQTAQRGIAVIPKSSNPERIRSNKQICDFELTKEEMQKFREIKDVPRIFCLEMLKGHPDYPFE